MSENPYLFIVGCPRSGTTLLQRMLDHHPLLAVANDTHFITRAIKGLSNGSDLPLTSALIQRVCSYHRFSRLGLSETAVSRAAEKSATYREFVSALYGEYGKLHGKVLAGEKTPDFVRYLAVLHALFPRVRTVHIIRDGRDVALSALQWARADKGPGKLRLWREEPVAVCALWWEWQVRSGQTSGVDLGPQRYHEMKYEFLVGDPEQTLRAATDFLELPFAPEMLAYHKGKVRYSAGLSAKKAWLPPTQGLRDWRSQMSARNLQLFEALAGDLLSTLGYERAFNTISPEITKVAAQCRSSWQAEKGARAGFQNLSATSMSSLCGARS
jgi:sulfotransferase family protein